MEPLLLIINLLFAIVAIIIIVKFFQVASDLRTIKKLLQEQTTHPIPVVEGSSEITIGSQIVEKKTEKQMKVVGFDEKTGKHICSNNNGITTVSLREDEIMSFDDFVIEYRKNK